MTNGPTRGTSLDGVDGDDDSLAMMPLFPVSQPASDDHGVVKSS